MPYGRSYKRFSAYGIFVVNQSNNLIEILQRGDTMFFFEAQHRGITISMNLDTIGQVIDLFNALIAVGVPLSKIQVRSGGWKILTCIKCKCTDRIKSEGWHNVAFSQCHTH